LEFKLVKNNKAIVEFFYRVDEFLKAHKTGATSADTAATAQQIAQAKADTLKQKTDTSKIATDTTKNFRYNKSLCRINTRRSKPQIY